MALASPQAYTHARDSGEIIQLRDQFTGNYKGLTELERLLTDREETLRATIKQQEQEEQNK